MICYLKYKWRKHLLLGKKLGEGREHLVYSKGDYVYKVVINKSNNIINFIDLIVEYIKVRNSIPFQVPCKFIGIAIFNGYICPIFKQRKLEPLNMDITTFIEESNKLLKNVILFKGQYICDIRPCNFGMLDGKLKAFDVYTRWKCENY
jgi:hypothetical protein